MARTKKVVEVNSEVTSEVNNEVVSEVNSEVVTETPTANTLADMVNELVGDINTTKPVTTKVTSSMIIAANLANGKITATNSLPQKWVGDANKLIVLTSAGANSAALLARISTNAKGGPCPFLMALYAGAQRGQTLSQAWAQCAHIAGHGQQGKGNGAYTSTSALNYFLNSKWFKLV
jgi:hypothetical protein